VTPELQALEVVVLRVIALGRARCGAGFGKYPLGVLDSVKELLPLVSWSEPVRARLAEFEARLKE
jgi:hypothetical protein